MGRPPRGHSITAVRGFNPPSDEGPGHIVPIRGAREAAEREARIFLFGIANVTAFAAVLLACTIVLSRPTSDVASFDVEGTTFAYDFTVEHATVVVMVEGPEDQDLHFFYQIRGVEAGRLEAGRRVYGDSSYDSKAFELLGPGAKRLSVENPDSLDLHVRISETPLSLGLIRDAQWAMGIGFIALAFANILYPSMWERHFGYDFIATLMPPFRIPREGRSIFAINLVLIMLTIFYLAAFIAFAGRF